MRRTFNEILFGFKDVSPFYPFFVNITNVVLGELKYNAVAFFACAAIALPAINKIKISSLIYVSTENISGVDAENIKY